MEIIKNFGVDWYLLGAQIINFLILFFLLKKFAYKPIFEMLQKRKETIQESIKNAEDAKLALEKATEQEKKILKKAQESAQQILTDAKAQADQLLEETKERTHTEVEKMISEAKEKMAQDTKEMQKQLAVSTAALAVDMVKDVVSGVFTEKEQKEMVEKMTKKIKVKS